MGPHRDSSRHRHGCFRRLVKLALGISLLPRPKWWDFGAQAASAPTGTLGLVPSSPNGSVPGGSAPPPGPGRSESAGFGQRYGLVRERGPMPAPKHPVRQFLAGIRFLSATTTAPGGVLCRDHHAHGIGDPTGPEPCSGGCVGKNSRDVLIEDAEETRYRHPLFVTVTLHSNPKRLRNHR
jgi:hypothetical protein